MATATPYTGEPFDGLTITDIEGSTGKTYYNLSIKDVSSSSFGDQVPFEGEAGSSFVLRFEWSSGSNNTSDTKADTATVVFRDPATGADIGTTQWNVAVNKASSGLATRTCHFDSDPLSGVLEAAREGRVYMHLYLERLNTDGTKRWQASSNGFLGGSAPRSYKYARGELVGTPVADTTPPSVPADVVATADSPTQITVTWTASTDNVGVTGYDVYRDQFDATDSPVATVTGTSFTDTSEFITPGSTHNYKIVAFDLAGNRSAMSAMAGVTTPTDPPPPGITVNIGDVTVTEGLVEAELDLFLSATVSTDVRVSYTTADGSAVAGSDYVAKSSFRTIPDGSLRPTSKPHVTVLEDGGVEGTEAFFVDIALDPVHPEVTLGDARGTVTITDNDSVPLPSLAKFMAGFRYGGIGQLNKYDAYLGKKLPCARVFRSNWGNPQSDANAAVSEGRLLLWSVKPPTNSSGTQKWTKITDGSNNAGIDSMGNALKAYGKEVVFIFHHEPHDDTSDLKSGNTGTSSEYRAAVRYIHDRWSGKGILAKQGGSGNVWMGYCAGDGGNWSQRPLTGGTDPMYTGGAYIDVLCHDSYNWYKNAGRNDAWRSFRQKWEDYAKLAQLQVKPLVAGETGSHPGADGNSRNQWFRDAGFWLKNGMLPNGDAVSKWFKGFCYFNRLHQDTGGSSEWRIVDINSSGNVFDVQDGRVGWQDAFRNDDFFAATPFSLK